jgi:hypothetical protein
MDIYGSLKEEFGKLIDGERSIGDEQIAVVSARTLSAMEAIGEPGRDDFPLLKGKEFMVEASFRDAKGQAFTDMPGNYRGSLSGVLSFDLSDNLRRAIFVASFNAVMRHKGRATQTVHCRDTEPALCAARLADYMKASHERPKVALVGYQPAMAEKLSKALPLRILDLDQENIGKEKFGITIEPPDKTADVLSWCSVVLATGSTAVNGTIGQFRDRKRIIFYGVTAAGIASLFGWERYCPFGH